MGDKSRGRPSTYTAELADKICSQLADGKSLRKVCSQKDIPNKSTVFEWLRKHKDFADQYARAKQEAADFYAEDIIEIADDARNDYMEGLGDDEAIGYKINGENIQRSKLRVDARKWTAAKLAPKKYGDKITQEHTGKIGITVTDDESEL